MVVIHINAARLVYIVESRYHRITLQMGTLTQLLMREMLYVYF